MDKLQLEASIRDQKGPKADKLRKQGIIPAVLYGHGIQTTSVSVVANAFERVLKKAGESTIIELALGGKIHPVLIHDVQSNFLTSEPDHVDFYQVNMTEKIKAKIALEFVGESVAVKNMGGVLVKSLTQIEVECLPADLPHNIPVDISILDIFGKSVLVKDLKVPAKVKILTHGEETIAKVQPPRDMEAELAPVVEDVSKVEGAAETKPVEGAAEGSEKGEKSAKGGSASGGKEKEKKE